MKLYNKKLTSLRELKQERQMLQRDIDKGIAKKQVKENTEETPKEKESFLSGLLSGATSGSLLTTALHIAPKVFDFIDNRRKHSNKTHQAADNNKPNKENIVANVLKEVIGGYIKWKAIELTYKGIQLALRSDKAKNLKKKNRSALKNIFKK